MFTELVRISLSLPAVLSYTVTILSGSICQAVGYLDTTSRQAVDTNQPYMS